MLCIWEDGYTTNERTPVGTHDGDLFNVGKMPAIVEHALTLPPSRVSGDTALCHEFTFQVVEWQHKSGKRLQFAVQNGHRRMHEWSIQQLHDAALRGPRHVMYFDKPTLTHDLCNELLNCAATWYGENYEFLVWHIARHDFAQMLQHMYNPHKEPTALLGVRLVLENDGPSYLQRV